VVPAPDIGDSLLYVSIAGRPPFSNTQRNLAPAPPLGGVSVEFIEGLLRARCVRDPERPTGATAPPDGRGSPDAESAPSTVSTPDGIRVNLVVFEPRALYRLHEGQPTVEFAAGAVRRRVSCLWGDLPRIFGRSVEGVAVRYLGNEAGKPVHYDAPGARWVTGEHPDMVKRGRGAWVPGSFTGTAGHKFMKGDGDKFVATNMLVMDCDGGDAHALAKELEAYAFIIHSTYKHTPDLPRCRVIFLLTTPCKSAREYDKAERFIAGQLNAVGFFVPPSDSTLGKLAYLPMHAPGVDPVFIKNSGRPLDLAPILAIPDPPERERKNANRETGTAGNALAWARRHVVACPLGRRHTTLYATAAWLAEATGATDDEIMKALLPAALSVATDGEAARSKKE
jgi:hypothetical protein